MLRALRTAAMQAANAAFEFVGERRLWAGFCKALEGRLLQRLVEQCNDLVRFRSSTRFIGHLRAEGATRVAGMLADAL